MSRKTIFATGEYYHLYNRGVDKRIVFENDTDRNRFIFLLYLCNGETAVHFAELFRDEAGESVVNQDGISATVFSCDTGKPLVAIGAYCLMANHFHLLVREIVEDGISTFMHKLSTAYTMYFNTGRKRTGALFQGRFKAEHVSSDNYLKYLFSYIHLNPLKVIDPTWKDAGVKSMSKTKQLLSSYEHSSYLDYVGTEREYAKVLNRKEFPDYFPTKSSFKNEIFDWISYKEASRSEAQPRANRG